MTLPTVANAIPDEPIATTSKDDGWNALGPGAAQVLAGDHTDDDGQAIDDYLTPNPNNDLAYYAAPEGDGNPGDLTEVSVSDAADHDSFSFRVDSFTGKRLPVTFDDNNDDVPTLDRIINGRVAFASNQQPVMALPADPNRKTLFFIGDADFKWADSNGGINTSGTWSASFGVSIDGYTGALWVLPVSADSTKYFSYWSVTR